MDTGKYKVIDLFAGCGGSALGFSKAGFSISAAVDIDKIATKTFQTNFPEAVAICSDIRDVKGKQLLKSAGIQNRDQFVLIACPPCQGFSSARRKSEAKSDPRNNLIYEFVRLVEETKPIVFVMENVPGLAKGIGKEVFNLTLKRLHSVGYRTVYDVADCADYGIPQRRKRLVLIGTRNSELRLTYPRKTNQDPNLKDAYLPAWKTVREAISDLPKVKVGQINPNDRLHKSANLSETNLLRMINTPHNGGDRTSWPEDLKLKCHIKTNGFKDVYGRMRWDTPSPTMTGGCTMVSKGRYGHPEQNRAITLREAARLQTFPDTFVFDGNFGDIAKQIGNAVPPLLAKRIADSLVESLYELGISSKFINTKKTNLSSVLSSEKGSSQGSYQGF
jgi:DNA (cytosine-5)-methyltransferase 1